MKFQEEDFFIGKDSNGIYCPTTNGKYIKIYRNYMGLIKVECYPIFKRNLERSPFLWKYKNNEDKTAETFRKIQRYWNWALTYRSDNNKKFHEELPLKCYSNWAEKIEQNPTTSPIKLFLESLPRGTYKM